MSVTTRILFVDDEPAYCRIFRTRIGVDPQFLIETTNSGDGALTRLQTFPADIVFADMNMPLMDGVELLTEIKDRYPQIFVIMLTGDDTTSQVVKAMKAGAYDYLLKPMDLEMVKRSIQTILDHKAAVQSGKSARCSQGENFCFENIIGQDRKMFEIYEQINQVAQSMATVLITGESGTGKELIAAAIHAKSSRKNKPFIQINCAALADGLISSELFGHEKGAFTGAITRKKGFFEQATGGTLFLDEIGDISPTTQVSLLRILELGTFQRVGGSETIRADVRLICATNRDLIAATREKLFREDLYYRLNVVSLQAPPLRDRKSDIPLLANYFLERFSTINNKQIEGISQDAMALLCAYEWPGNCRELANIIEHAVVFCREKSLTRELLPPQLKTTEPSVVPVHHTAMPTLAEAERTLIKKALEESNWNLKMAAEALDIARGTLYSKIEKYHLHKPD
ncbi:MAG: sigma-54 dependent transcriptional regulator [Trichlorobacter sp.]|uniref:sigma-54-dependent transcriptional regulator n=1 Tax=Trichlorobacter sp. TaxID=2911007 RepID=UPI00256CFA4D|nr:sigma-54 dependent transcriptional regulator [Trichlorobacter sp.]MDK9716967.1 sigma-54 dependent transcriptional regulator [Trichlorobacter sp.]